MLLGGYALLIVAAALAWTLSRRAVDHRPVTLLLLVYLVTNLGRRALVALILAPAHVRFDPSPIEGWAEVAVHVDTALFLAPRAMMAGVAVVLARRYLAAELAALVVSVGAIATWIRARRASELQHVSVALVVAAELVIAFAGPWRCGRVAAESRFLGFTGQAWEG